MFTHTMYLITVDVKRGHGFITNKDGYMKGFRVRKGIGKCYNYI